MIRTFRDKETEEPYLTGRSRRFQKCSRQAFQKLRMLDAAQNLKDVGALPGNRLEALRGDRDGNRLSLRGDVQKKPMHPGEILRDQFMKEFSLSMNRLARDLRVPVTRISEITNERRGITPDTALRLARYFGTSAEFWINLQTAYDLDLARSAENKVHLEVHPVQASD